MIHLKQGWVDSIVFRFLSLNRNWFSVLNSWFNRTASNCFYNHPNNEQAYFKNHQNTKWCLHEDLCKLWLIKVSWMLFCTKTNVYKQNYDCFYIYRHTLQIEFVHYWNVFTKTHWNLPLRNNFKYHRYQYIQIED